MNKVIARFNKMSFSPTLTQESQTVPGVKFTVHRMGFGRRTDLDFKTLKLRQRLRELEAEQPPDTPREKELREQIGIARHKASAVPEAEMEAVIANDLLPLLRELNDAADTETRKRRSTIHEEYSIVESRAREEWIRSGLVAIEGGEVDGMTADQLLDYGPSELAAEIYNFIASDGKLNGEERKNSQSPTTSDAVAGGISPNTTAPDASLQQAATT